MTLKIILVNFLINITLLVQAQSIQWPIIQFKFGHESSYSFTVDMYNNQSLLICTGKVNLRHLSDKVVFQFEDVRLPKTIALSAVEIMKNLASPIVLPSQNGSPLDADGMNYWNKIDPRVIVKIFKYFLYSDGSPLEFGWESEDFLCEATYSQEVNQNGSSTFDVSYDLKTCLAQESVTHYRSFLYGITRRIYLTSNTFMCLIR